MHSERNIYIYGLYTCYEFLSKINNEDKGFNLKNVNLTCTAEDIYQIVKNKELFIITKDNENIFLRGYFDYGKIYFDNDFEECHFIIEKKYYNLIPTVFSSENENLIIIKGCNILEFMDYIYKDASYYKETNYKIYKNILYKTLDNKKKKFKFYKDNIDAITPSKNRITDSGYDIYIINKISQKNNLYMFDTGIIVEPPNGIYFDLVPRSSIIKHGYILANSVGIIDQTFRGTIKVALIKIDENAKELELPMKIAQLIPRQVIQLEMTEETNKDNILPTVRNNGEYGSSGN